MIKIIALLLVMVIINLFMIFAIIKAYEKTEETVVGYFVKKTSELENKVDMSVGQENVVEVPVWYDLEKIVFEKQNVPVFSEKDDIRSINYKQKDIGRDYKLIKANMCFDKDRILESLIMETQNDPVEEKVLLAKDVCDRLDFDSIYRISCLDSENQEMEIGSMLNENEEILIDDFLESEHPAEFSAVEFYNYLKQIIKVNDIGYSVSTGWSGDDFSSFGRDVDTVYDDSITEGIKIIHGSKLYDYSV